MMEYIYDINDFKIITYLKIKLNNDLIILKNKNYLIPPKNKNYLLILGKIILKKLTK